MTAFIWLPVIIISATLIILGFRHKAKLRQPNDGQHEQLKGEPE